MVRAILEGRKTITRRVVSEKHMPLVFAAALPVLLEACPYGPPGSKLWVRESCRADELPSGLDGVRYLADDSFIPIANSEEASEQWVELACYGMKKSGRPECRTVPSIHMPRWASRILLEITNVRAEKLSYISEADAIAEGVNVHPDHHGKPRDSIYSPVQAYRDLWEQINGSGSWAANPFVWVIQFTRVTP
jgi:hypothetical protein